MQPDGDPERRRMAGAAESRYPQIADPQVFGCWHVVVEAARQGWLKADGRLSVRRLVGTLESGGSLGVEEYDMAVDGDRVIVSFLDEQYSCPRAAMIHELRRLDEQLHTGPSVPGAGAAASAPGLDPSEIGRLLDALRAAAAAAAGTGPDTVEAARLRQETAEALRRLRATDIRPPADPIRQEAAEALRAFADWAEDPVAGGARVDAVIRRLEDTIGPLLPGRRAEEQQTRDRIAAGARDAIARRLAEAAGGHPAAGAGKPEDPAAGEPAQE